MRNTDEGGSQDFSRVGSAEARWRFPFEEKTEVLVEAEVLVGETEVPRLDQEGLWE